MLINWVLQRKSISCIFLSKLLFFVTEKLRAFISAIRIYIYVTFKKWKSNSVLNWIFLYMTECPDHTFVTCQTVERDKPRALGSICNVDSIDFLPPHLITEIIYAKATKKNMLILIFAEVFNELRNNFLNFSKMLYFI